MVCADGGIGGAKEVKGEVKGEENGRLGEGKGWRK